MGPVCKDLALGSSILALNWMDISCILLTAIGKFMCNSQILLFNYTAKTVGVAQETQHKCLFILDF